MYFKIFEALKKRAQDMRQEANSGWDRGTARWKALMEEADKIEKSIEKAMPYLRKTFGYKTNTREGKPSAERPEKSRGGPDPDGTEP